MAVVMQRETTEYIYVGITGDVVSDVVEMALLPAETRPQETDWNSAEKVEDSQHELWDDATSAGLTGDWYVALLVGEYGANEVNPGEGDYAVWVRLTDTVERPVRIAPVTVEIV